MEARAQRVRDNLRRTVRENHSLKTAGPHTPFNGQTPRIGAAHDFTNGLREDVAERAYEQFLASYDRA